MNNNLECGIWDKEGVCLVPIARLEELPLYHRETIASDYFMHFMINESAGLFASTIEVLGTHADLQIRRAAPMPPEIADKFDAKLARDQQLSWEAPVCGVIQL